jgi:hypothetical protein
MNYGGFLFHILICNVMLFQIMDRNFMYFSHSYKRERKLNWLVGSCKGKGQAVP